MPIGTIIIAVLIFLTLFLSFVTIQQGFIGVTTIFGKFNRILRPGLNFKIPFIEKVYKRVSIQNRSSELGFQAVTIDQATVHCHIGSLENFRILLECSNGVHCHIGSLEIKITSASD